MQNNLLAEPFYDVSSNILVRVNHLSKTFKGETKPAIDDISLYVKKGEMTALVGPDGAGKTTFLRLLIGLLVSDADCQGKNTCKTISVDNFCPYTQLNDVKKITGYMPQKFGLYEDLSVIENLKLYLSLRNTNDNILSGSSDGQRDVFINSNNNKVDNAGMEAKINTLLEFSDLKDFKNRLAGRLSGGMKQKLGLCCTLISNPSLLLLDEPSVGVDPLSRRELMKLVNNLVKENNIAVIWSTSYLDEAENFSRVFLFSGGKKLYDGSPDEASKKMEGKVFLTKKEGENNRTLLRGILKTNTNLSDATIEGDALRLVFKEKPQNLVYSLRSKTDKQLELNLESTKPRFEDFVIDVLGGQKPYTDEALKNAKHQDSPEIAIEARGLTKIYMQNETKFVAADNITFQIKKGEIFGLLGPNGAGKSTTFKMLCGLTRPSSGNSSIMDIKMDEDPSLARSYLGYMAQKFSLFGNLSIRQNLNFFGGVYGMYGKNKRDRIEKLLEFFNLKQYENTDALALPLGYKQRLALCAAIIHNPPVLFLDEPTSGVDPISRREFWNQINSLVEGGTTVLVTTHFMDEAQFCDRVSLIYKGKSLIISTPDALKDSVKSDKITNPTMEDAFVELIKRTDGVKVNNMGLEG